ncbi:MAG: hypothetical protein OXH39_15630 [Candidatus Poribacteria bacterium]|nr:hypothetical protein [Candidatus Poribacteria bacterium]
MKNYIFVLFLFLLLVPFLVSAGVPDATIPFDCPNIPNAKFQFHFTREFIALAGTAELFDTVSDIYFHTYDTEAGIFDKFTQYYDEALKAANWQSLQKDNDVLLYILEAASAQSAQSDKTILGIFAVVESDSNVHLLNIVGDIPPQQIGRLLANLDQLGIEIPALKSLDAQIFQKFETPPERMPLPTLFRTADDLPHFFSIGFSKKEESSKFGLTFSRDHNESLQGHWTYYGHPIERIDIRSDNKNSITQIKQALQNGTADIEEVLKSLPSPNTPKYKRKLLVRSWERSATIIVGNLPYQKDEPSMLAKQFRTREGEPIHEIRIQGHQDTHPDDVRKELEKGPEEIEKAIVALPIAMSGLKAARFRIEEEGDRRTAVVTIVEKPLPARFYFDSAPRVGFNRVSGWELGAHIDSGYRKGKSSDTSYHISVPREFRGDDLSKFFGRIGYGFGNKQVYYQVGGKAAWGERHSWHLGLTTQLHRTTSSIAPDLFPVYDDTEMTILRVFGVPDHQNYYLREGFEVTLQWRPVKQRHSFKFVLLAESHDSLRKSTDWHFLNWRSKSEVRENPVITPTRMRSVMFKYDYSTRHDFLGWHNTFFAEHSNTAIGSEFNFTRYQLHLRYAHPFGRHRLRTRAIGSFSTDSLPIQRQFVIGGAGLLSGYPLYAFAGDRGFLFNVEYLYHLPQLFIWKLFSWGKNIIDLSDANIFAVFFFDMGQAWDVLDKTSTFTPKSDVGIGFQFGENYSILRFSVAKALELEQGMRFNTVWFYSF